MPCPFSFFLPLGVGLAIYFITVKGMYYGVKLPENWENLKFKEKRKLFKEIKKQNRTTHYFGVLRPEGFKKLGRKISGLHPREKSRNETILKTFCTRSKLINIAKICQIIPELLIV